MSPNKFKFLGVYIVQVLRANRGPHEAITIPVLMEFSLTVKAVTLIIISWRCSASSSTKQEKSGSFYNLVNL